MIAAGKGFVKTAEGGACPAACARTGPGAVKENVGNTGVRHERNGRETPRPPARDFYKRAARKRGGALPRGRKLCYNKLL